MKWATRELVHFDRVASAWLILRLIDNEAHFVFLAEAEEPPDDATPFGLPGVKFSSHAGGHTTFSRLLEAYGLDDPALSEMATIVLSAVSVVMEGATSREREAGPAAMYGILGLTEGVMLTTASDAECVRVCLPIYDALYGRLQAQGLMEARQPSPPASILQQTMAFARAIARLRKAGSVPSIASFSHALQSLAAGA